MAFGVGADLRAPVDDRGLVGSRHRISVLVVEDSIDHRLLMERRLTAAGMDVTGAATADEALAAIEAADEGGLDLVLLDYRLPQVSGLELMNIIRQRNPGLSVVMVTGMGSTDVAVEAMRQGAIDYLAKNPGYLQSLPQVIERAWRQHDLARRAGELQRLALLLNTATDREQVFHEIVAGASRLLETESAVLLIEDVEGGFRVVARLGPASSDLQAIATVAVEEVPHTGDPVVVDDHLLVALPRDDHEPEGLLALWNEGATEYVPEELSLARAFASFAGIALRNLRRRELEEALIAELEQTIDARRDFVASVSHELRTPLTSISGFAETLLGRWEQVGEQDKLLFLQKITDHSEELYELVSQLIDVAGMERGRRFSARLEDLDLATCVPHALDTLERLLVGRELRLKVTPVAVRADEGLLRRTLVNLVSNAAKFSDPGSLLEVEVTAGDDHARLAVTDHGVGLSRREASRVFEPFFRTTYSVANAVRGSGIGLSLVREYVRTMGGQIGVQSEEGVGSTFWFTLPLATGMEPTTEITSGLDAVLN